jgi:hypothetical protein
METSSADRAAVDSVPSRQRSRITNGSALLPNTDGRGPWVRRVKDVISEHLADCGGKDATSAAERSLIRRCAVITTELEMLEARFAQAEGMATATDLDLYQRMAGNLRRLLESIGLQRRAKDIGPTLGELLRQDHERQQLQAAKERVT